MASEIPTGSKNVTVTVNTWSDKAREAALEARKAHRVGDKVQITGPVQGKGKHGVITETAPSGHYHGVSDANGKHLGYYHESDLTHEGGDKFHEEVAAAKARGKQARSEAAVTRGVRAKSKGMSAADAYHKKGIGDPTHKLPNRTITGERVPAIGTPEYAKYARKFNG